MENTQDKSSVPPTHGEMIIESPHTKQAHILYSGIKTYFLSL